ncbi:MAG: DEAD/DEAH box helicase [Candidatus Omnitrophota bacterium]|jgi:SNF2 family DNA or RNA helicase|nr:MAG: DEAD/DEAH box helicase [Candidatus Omnitrophota bacterium]
MIIFHAGFSEIDIHIWGETPIDSTRETPPPTVYLFDAGYKMLAQTLKDLECDCTITKKDSSLMTIWLPTKAGQPIPSSSIIASPSASRRKIEIKSWRVTAIHLNVDCISNLLCRCIGKELLAPGVLIGRDMAYWSVALRFAGGLVAKQKFLPDVVREKNTFRAMWKPVLMPEEREKHTALAKIMPDSCRALTLNDSTAPCISAESVLSDFLDRTVDYLVRNSQRMQTASPKTGSRGKRKTASFDSIHDQWLHALRSPDGIMEGEQSELMKFMAQIRDWRRPISMTVETPFRLCFRLEEPDVETPKKGKLKLPEDAWYVRYLLQDNRDPSLLIPAENAWKSPKNTAVLFKKAKFNPHEYLLFSLGQASGICPHIESSLKRSNPGGYEVDSNGAFTFLTERASILEQMSFGVLLPAWWTRKGTKQRLSLKAKVKSPRMQGDSGLSLNEIVQFQWEVALGDHTLTLAELQELAKLKSSLVKVRGQWVLIGAEEIREAIDFWKRKANDEGTVREIVRMALGQANTPTGMNFSGISATGWIADFLDRLNGNTPFAEIDAPAEFQGALRPYQRKGYSWLDFLQQWGLGACLADDMGLGKTIQTLALLQRNWHANGKKPTLLICPTSVVGNWQKEASRFTPELPVMIHHGAARKKDSSFKKEAKNHTIVISSYALLHRDYEMLKTISWSGIVLDEAQNIKNPETKQAKAARSLPADYRIALTGTPVENNVGDLWSIMEFLNPGFLGTQAEFKRSFFIPIQALRDPEATQRLKRLTGPFILRRLKTDKSIISDLPEKMEMKVYCNLTQEQASLYQAVVNDTMNELKSAEGIQRKGLVLATLSKLKQVCNHPAQFAGDNSAIPGRSGKLARLTEMLEELLQVNDRALIFSQFFEMGDLLKTYLQNQFGQEALFLHGRVPKKKRDEMVERFQSETGPNIFILSLKAGGTGLNLTNANHVFHFDRWWNPAVENQATDRAFRIGQTKNVQVHKFLCVGTLEERIDEMIENKKEIAEGVIGAGEGWLTELSTNELKELFALSKEAVAD